MALLFTASTLWLAPRPEAPLAVEAADLPAPVTAPRPVQPAAFAVAPVAPSPLDTELAHLHRQAHVGDGERGAESDDGREASHGSDPSATGGTHASSPYAPPAAYSGGAGAAGSHDPNAFSAATVSDLPLPLIIQEALPPNVPGVARNGEVATFGMPFSKGAVLEVNGRPALAVQGTDVHQARTLARWPDGSVRWAQLDAQVDLAAGAMNTALSVVPGVGRSAGLDIARPYLAGKAVVLDTGPMQAVILTKAFNLFAYVRVDGESVVRPNLGLGLYGTGLDGGTLRPGPTTKVVVEENGPARAVVRADGPLIDASGATVIDFTCRIAARAGGRELEVTLTLRNASKDRPWHTQLEGVELIARSLTGPYPIATVPLTGGATFQDDLPPGGKLSLYQARSTAPIGGTDSPLWQPHIPRKDGSLTSFVEEGLEVVEDGQVLHSLGNPADWPAHGWLDLKGQDASVTVAVEHMPYVWPAAIEAGGDGLVVAGLFTRRCPEPYTFVYQQHESRRAVFAFSPNPIANPIDVARRLDLPLTGRAADYLHYDRAKVFPYRLLTPQQHSEAYALMGITHTIQVVHPQFEMTRYLYKGTTGPSNNGPTVETHLAGEWLRLGWGGSFLEGLDLALWKSEWQIARSDGFHEKDAPAAINPDLPHTEGHVSDDEHRYRDGIVLAYFLTGDERLREALLDEVEVLTTVDLWPHERSMYQTLRAMGSLLTFSDDPTLLSVLKQRLAYITAPLINIEAATSGFGWESSPGQGQRRYYVFSGDLNSEKPPGEHFQARGFISGTLGPAGYHSAAFALLSHEPGNPLVSDAAYRAADLAWWTRHELYPFDPDPAQRRLIYSYAVTQQTVSLWENFQFHPILLGMADGFTMTGDVGYLQAGVSQVEAHAAIDTGPFQTNLHLLDSRLECQHFFTLYREWALGISN